ncbi:MAG: hypothetical protein JWN40_453 [Phycisphaerales bacterium]|nr:hypothetical protein [Phycisphaerales bacterium]
MPTPPPLPQRRRGNPGDNEPIPLAPLPGSDSSPADDPAVVPLARLAPRRVIAVPPQQGWLGSVVPERKRPGLLNAIGVLSIVLGSLGAVMELISILPVVHIYFGNANAPRSLARVVAPLPAPPQFAPYGGDLAAVDGLGRADALIVITGANAMLGGSQQLSADRQIMFRRLLAECGRRVIAAPAPLNMATVHDQVTRAGQLPAGADGLRESGTHYFRTTTGVVLLDDALARFIPSGAGQGGEIRVEDDGVRDVQTGRRWRSAATVADELDELHARLGPSFNAMQAAALAQHRLAQLPQRRSPIGYPAWPPPDPGGAARIAGTTLIYNANLWILADGRMIADTRGRDERTGLAAATVPNARSGPGFRTSTGWLLIGGTIVELLLSVFLIFCGITVFGDSPRAAGRHVLYAWLRFAAIIMGIILAQRFISELPSDPQPPRPGTAADLSTMLDANTMRVSTIVGVFLSLLYPIGLLYALRAPKVRAWYAELGGGIEPISPQLRSRMWPAVAWVRGRAGRVTAAVIAGLAALAAIGHLLLISRDGGAIEHGIWTALCAVAAVICVASVLVKPRGLAVAVAIMVFLVVRPAVAQTTRPTSAATRADAARQAARDAYNNVEGRRLSSSDDGEWLRRFEMGNVPQEADIERMLKIPGLNTEPPSAVRFAVASALCRCGPAKFEKWASEALSSDAAVSARAWRLLTLASSAPLPRALTLPREPGDRDRGFNAAGARTAWGLQDVVAVGAFERTLIVDPNAGLRTRVARGLLTAEIPIRLGPHSRKVAQMAVDGADLKILQQELKSPALPPRRTNWEMPAKDASSPTGAALNGLVRWLSIVVVPLTGLLAVGYYLLRPRVVSQ